MRPTTPLTPERRTELLAAQKATRAADGNPHFAPYDGICSTCRGDLVEHYGDGYATAWITGCPLCCRSYCD